MPEDTAAGFVLKGENFRVAVLLNGLPQLNDLFAVDSGAKRALLHVLVDGGGDVQRRGALVKFPHVALQGNVHMLFLPL